MQSEQGDIRIIKIMQIFKELKQGQETYKEIDSMVITYVLGFPSFSGLGPGLWYQTWFPMLYFTSACAKDSFPYLALLEELG